MTILLLSLLIQLNSYGQSKKVLFIGNSYTGVNNLPQLIHDLALSGGDTLIFDAHTPGGARLMHHAASSEAMTKINSDVWDHVVLQGQSQEPSFPIAQVEDEVYPYATILCDSIRANNDCTRPVFYMTWGRENGDASNCASWPPVCTYERMDSLLNLRYRMMGEDNDAYVSPVGAVWRLIRETYPEIDLYSSDGSHPSQAGSFAAACSFYSIFFQKDPSLLSYNYSITEDVASSIKDAAKEVVFDNLLEWNVGLYDPSAEFIYTQSGTEVSFINNSIGADSYLWNFGDGETSTESDPSHIYENNESYSVELVATTCGMSNAEYQEIVVGIVSIAENESSFSDISVYPNPAQSEVLVTFSLKEDEKASISIIDINGKVVIKTESSQPSTNLHSNMLNLSGLTAGIYTIEIRSENTLSRRSLSIMK